MRPKSIILLVLALGCGLVASIGINQVMANRRQPVEAAVAETTSIFVAMADIAMGDPVTAQMVKLEEWPKDKVQAGALSNLDDIEGRRCRAKIFEGEPILEPKLLAKGESGANATDLIPKGYRVVTVSVDPVKSASGLIQPGDRVDVLVHIRENKAMRELARTFLQNVKVFSVDQNFQRTGDDQASSAVKTIALLVTAEQAEMVFLATKLGEVQLVMRSVNDDENVATQGVGVRELTSGDYNDDKTASPLATAADLNAIVNPPKPEPAPEPHLAEPAAPRRKAHVMVVLRGTEREELTFTEDGRPSSSSDDDTASDAVPPDLAAPADRSAEGDDEPRGDDGPSGDEQSNADEGPDGDDDS
jgi:pilus assembly protein CpaB